MTGHFNPMGQNNDIHDALLKPVFNQYDLTKDGENLTKIVIRKRAGEPSV
jgi:hypothetical protein